MSTKRLILILLITLAFAGCDRNTQVRKQKVRNFLELCDENATVTASLTLGGTSRLSFSCAVGSPEEMGSKVAD